MDFSQFEPILIIIAFLTIYALVVVLAIHFIFRKNILLRNYIFLGLVALGVLVSYYNSFKNSNNWILSILLTIAFIGLARQQWIYRKKVKNQP
ncbi:hypothetical protein [Paenibacillus sp. UMB4589-SE434]|uniref:hypothetical protein n=1 Tax=Paenibacillus sp. UMB4589-SE434 TaxID=3046314 RepID=UPI00254F703F|nr:hypothetical protein [Paenibacillus sp. UMB4589-SE434]MDK8182474.1 hypothetical protein [Paenibacillus sp. UMB4589-SE434]